MTRIFQPIFHVDFSSQYPNTIMAYNLSPETIELLEIIKCESEEFTFINEGSHMQVWMPDTKIIPSQISLVKIRIRKDVDSVNRIMLRKVFTERLKYKALYRQSLLTEPNEQLNSLQNIYKLVLNTTYGYNGAKFAKWGDMLVAMACTAISRYYTRRIADFLGDDNWIEIDTDGVWCKNKPDLDAINKFLENIAINEHGCTYSTIKMDYEEEESAYFYKMKNYIIRSHHKKLSFTGCSFVNRKNPLFIQNGFEPLVHAMFDGKPPELIAKEFLDFEKYSMKDFGMNTKLNRSLDDYKSENSLNLVLAKQLQEAGHQLSFGMQMTYVKTKTGYKPIELAKREDLDMSYYAKYAEKLLMRLSLLNKKSMKQVKSKLTRLKQKVPSHDLGKWM